MLKSFKYRILPTEAQSELINKHIGSSRFVYNLALETKTMAYAGNQINLSCFDLIKQLPDLKKECTWLKEINSQSLQAPIRNLDNAFTRFYKGQGNFPKYKSKKRGKQSFHIPQNVIVENGKLIVPKFKEGVEIVLHRETKGVIKSATISRTPTGKYFVSILWYGVNLLKIGKFEPSSKTCFNCGTVNKDLTLKDREWTCVKCNTKHDRDINAAVNIKNFALRNYVSGTDTKTRNELPTLVGVLTSEAQPIGSAVGG